MSKGYICLAQNNKDTDYIKLAYALALSIKNTQSEVANLSIVTNDEMPNYYKDIFDKVIPIKSDRAENENWKLHNIVDLYDYSPYDETVILDSDMLFLTDVSHWWNYLNKRDLWFTNQIKNYRAQIIDWETIYRQEFVKNSLPNIYMAFFYFKKGKLAFELFKQAQIICDDWSEYVNRFLFKKRPKVFSTDVAFALAVKSLGITDKSIMPFLPFPYFTHMKTQSQGWNLTKYQINEDWRDYIPVGFDKFNNSLGIKLGLLRQTSVLHYHVKDFLTDEMIEILESYNEK